MLFIFKSKCCADITMLGTHAKLLLGALGKDASEAGIVTAEQIPAAIRALEEAITQSEQRDDEKMCSADAVQDGAWDDTQVDDLERENMVSLRARYTPVLNMLEAAHKGSTHVIWEIE